MKHKINRFVAALVAMTALTSGMVGFSANAAEVTTPETEIVIDRYVQYSYFSFNLNTSNGTTSDDSLTITRTANENDFKISYGACSVGQANVNVKVNGSSIGNYIIPSSTGVGITRTFSCNAGDTITLTITPASGYVKAVGGLTFYW
ncbi:hypothetical protein [Ruminococcus flavefaciens]|uniref:Uncharacterized protein n=1 Tax=Ruminococcus flavefaciens TaxID=1265 RepID=A0A315XYL0_RUMFL|nr:hypothetical protein [Ruminococcus flavefaciens]PWJ11943.1 hypothetical protein IE37_02208 [Ruminococcus flavefaciens]SSA50228.1 hypothetical protein SAMN02910325_02208 [Ruminococcus flavefaciens]